MAVTLRKLSATSCFVFLDQTMTPAEHQQNIGKARANYAANLGAHLDNLQQIVDQLKSATSGSELLREFYLKIHNLSGSAATAGYSRISRWAQLLEADIQKDLPTDFAKEQTQKTEPFKPLPKQRIKFYSDSIETLEQLIREGTDSSLNHSPSSSSTIVAQTSPRLTYTIYLIEPDQDIGKEMEAQLNHAGFSVLRFSDPENANRAIDECRPDAILTNLNSLTPSSSNTTDAGESSPSVLNPVSFKESIGCCDIPVIFISSRNDWEARLAAVRAGGKAYVTFPIDYMQLFNQLDRLVKRPNKEPFRVLIVDDQELLAEHYASVLRQANVQVETLNSSGELLKTIAHFKPELILMDIYMPHVSGTEAASVIRQHQELIGIPIIFITAESDTDKIQHMALQDGDDLLQKPIKDSQLITTVKLRAERARTLNTLMFRDGLTGLLNHSTLKSRLQTELERSHRLNKPLSFVMLDLDHFKDVNDSHGHATGDKVLKSLARMLDDRLRKSDQIGRYGGEEFGIILPDTNQIAATVIIDEIREQFAALAYSSDEINFHCTFSAGIAQLDGNDNADTLINRADEMLYLAKNSGRNRVVHSH